MEKASFRELHQRLLTHILGKEGCSSQAERQAAFDNSALLPSLSTLINKVANSAHKITDNDIRAVKDAGIGEDQIFEFIVCAAVGEASRQYNNALAALAQVATDREGGANAS